MGGREWVLLPSFACCGIPTLAKPHLMGNRAGGGREMEGWQENAGFQRTSIKKVKRQSREWEKISANHISDKRLISREYVTEPMFLPKRGQASSRPCTHPETYML